MGGGNGGRSGATDSLSGPSVSGVDTMDVAHEDGSMDDKEVRDITVAVLLPLSVAMALPLPHSNRTRSRWAGGWRTLSTFKTGAS